MQQAPDVGVVDRTAAVVEATARGEPESLIWADVLLGTESDPSGLRQTAGADGWWIASGYGKWKDSTLRIGHMGDVTPADLEALLDRLERYFSASRESTKVGGK